jgi:hypothetical protein
VRLTARVRLAFKYQTVATDIVTHHNDAIPAAAPFITAGALRSGDFYSNAYSVLVHVMPVARAYLTGQFTFQNTRTTAFDNGANSILTYQGDVYSVLATAAYAFDDKTDLIVQYRVSWAENFEDNGSGSVPGFGNSDYGFAYGVDYQRHGLSCQLTRRLNKNAVAKVGLQFPSLQRKQQRRH